MATYNVMNIKEEVTKYLTETYFKSDEFKELLSKAIDTALAIEKNEKKRSDFTIYEMDEDTPTYYGLETKSITMEDIQALICGKKIHTDINGEEYAIEISLDRGPSI